MEAEGRQWLFAVFRSICERTSLRSQVTVGDMVEDIVDRVVLQQTDGQRVDEIEARL